MSHPRRSLLLAFLAAALYFAAAPAWAGCGCDKPPPPPASLRPYVTYAGMPVTFFSSTFTVGTGYTVTFTSGISGQSASVTGTVVNLRDLADGYYKPQLTVPLPVLPLGPASITVLRDGATQPEIAIADSTFTVAPTPIAVPYSYGAWQYPNSQIAVDRSGVAYVSLDVSGVTTPLVFDASFAGYPLRFAATDIVIHNTQGFLMQLLVNSGSPVPGMFVNPPPTSADSNTLHYSRHEFSTYFLQHMENQPHAVDPADGNWHLDGTRHVDHHHLIIAINGKLNGIAPPAPGASPPFNLIVKSYSLFYTGLTGTSSVTMSGAAVTDSFDSNTNLVGSRGDVFTLGTLTMKSPSTVKGNATANYFSVATSGATITGARYAPVPTTFMAITVPTLLPSLGKIAISTPTTKTVYGPGSFLVSSLALSKGATLFVDNTAGPVTFYVIGSVSVSGATIRTADPKPEKFAIYVASTSSVSLSTTTSFNGVIYAPTSAVALSGAGQFTGAFFGKTLALGTYARVHYDSSLLSQ